MIVVVADHIPPAVRGRMKLWFVEVRPNVFVSGVKDGVAKEVVEYLYNSCPVDSNLTIIQSTMKPPYYAIKTKGLNSRVKEIYGLPRAVARIGDEFNQFP